MLLNKWSVVYIFCCCFVSIGENILDEDNLSIQGCKRYPAVSDVSHMVANRCRRSSRVFHGIVNRNEFYSQYPVFDGIEGICRYSKFDLSVSIWLRGGIAIQLNTVKYHHGNQPLVVTVCVHLACVCVCVCVCLCVCVCVGGGDFAVSRLHRTVLITSMFWPRPSSFSPE